MTFAMMQEQFRVNFDLAVFESNSRERVQSSSRMGRASSWICARPEDGIQDKEERQRFAEACRSNSSWVSTNLSELRVGYTSRQVGNGTILIGAGYLTVHRV
jgi:hypothetical protein